MEKTFLYSSQSRRSMLSVTVFEIPFDCCDCSSARIRSSFADCRCSAAAIRSCRRDSMACSCSAKYCRIIAAIWPPMLPRTVSVDAAGSGTSLRCICAVWLVVIGDLNALPFSRTPSVVADARNWRIRSADADSGVDEASRMACTLRMSIDADANVGATVLTCSSMS